MRCRLDITEALEEIIKSRQGTVLERKGGDHSTPKLMKGQDEFSSEVQVREYSILTGNGYRARITFRYDWRVEGCDASFYIALKDIMAIKAGAKDLDRQIAHTRGNGHDRFELTNVNKDGAEIKLNKEVK